MMPSTRSGNGVKCTLSDFLVCWRWGLYAVTDKQGDYLHSYANYLNTKHEENVKNVRYVLDSYTLVNFDASHTVGKSHGQNLARSAFEQWTVHSAIKMVAGCHFKAFLVGF